MRPTEAARKGLPAVLGALAGGALAGFYGVPAGALLGVMGAEIYFSQRLKSELAAHLADPASAPPPRDEPEAGCALLAGLAALEARRLGVPPESAGQVLRGSSAGSSVAAAWTALASASVRPSGDIARDFAVLGAAFDGRAVRSLRPLAADAFFALRRASGEDFTYAEDLDTSARLAALGVPEDEVRRARTLYFPGYRDAWDILDIPPCSAMGEVRRAWRKVSRLYHPDGPGGDEERFREARKAYECIIKTHTPGNFPDAF